MAIKIVERYSAAPSQGAAAEQSLPLLYFDMIWLHFRPTETLFFYSFKCSESNFLDTIVVQLKHTLSIALKHFLPLAGKIIFPLSSAGMPVSRYAAGDSVALTIAVSDADFTDLTGNHSKAADEFHHFVPHMPPPVYSDDDIKFESIAIQATLFPNKGICIGFTHHHAICDLAGLIGFIRAWASVNKLNSDGNLVGNALPLYDRSRVQDAAKLTPIGWARATASRPNVSLPNYLPPNKLRATFILSEDQIEKLKSIVRMKKPSVGRVSAFVVGSALLWSCLAKSGEEAADDEPEYLTSPVDCRARLEPPLPDNYFGNCVVLLRVDSTHGRLRGEEGFVAAAEAIADAIGKTVKHGRGIVEFFENRPRIISELIGKRVVRLAGSSRLDHYDADYGWGRAIKYECIHTDYDDGNVNLCKARDGGIEIGLSLPQAKMDAFAVMFNKNLYKMAYQSMTAAAALL